MNVPMPHKRDRGQVGIGTLIVFIAMVLVAAIAAGVLINTAGFLQSQSEQTGQQSSSQVSDRLQVINVVGDSVTDRNVTVINMTVAKAPGANDIDLNTTTIQYISSDEIVDLTHAARANNSGTAVFNTTTIQDDDNSIDDSKVINSQDDRATVTLRIGKMHTSTVFNASDISNMTEGQEVTIELTTQAGGTTTSTLTAPNSLSNKESVTL
jgi:flagellin FlaB